MSINFDAAPNSPMERSSHKWLSRIRYAKRPITSINFDLQWLEYGEGWRPCHRQPPPPSVGRNRARCQRHAALVGLLGIEREFQATRHAETVARPALQGHAHDAQDTLKPCRVRYACRVELAHCGSDRCLRYGGQLFSW